jgi:hypothetical protein
MSELHDILKALKEPMPYKWRVQSFSQHKAEATLVAYIDARDVMDRLDEVCANGWQRDHKQVKENLFSGVGINLGNNNWLWRWDCGTESQTEAEKGESSDSFKRAAVNWGVGRFLYDLSILKLPASEVKSQGKWPYVVDNSGKRVWDLTKHCNDVVGIKPIPINNDKLISYNEMVRSKIDPIFFIKTALANNDLAEARRHFLDLTKDELSILWIAPSKGGIFTTQEIALMKTESFRTALDSITGANP